MKHKPRWIELFPVVFALLIGMMVILFFIYGCHVPPATGWMWNKKCVETPKDSICLYGESADKWREIVGEPDNTFKRNDTTLFIWYIPKE